MGGGGWEGGGIGGNGPHLRPPSGHLATALRPTGYHEDTTQRARTLSPQPGLNRVRVAFILLNPSCLTFKLEESNAL